jgi:hypothetical protein
MARGPATFKQADLTRALKAAKEAKVDLHIRIAADGTFQIDTDVMGDSTKPATDGKSREGQDPWDAALN